ncbi:MULTISPECIES: MFS transporter [Rhodococcus]|uniref:MFS transporter n=1 Tax=Rhodococcus TaxID=1827 RepID=UPI0024B763C4|nr:MULTISPECIES: MFS transporter [Rhodococcus]MDI9941465.1 MFS transporter [Rhodococcus sp. IEGM 1351]MDV6242067.1 MFS transporter [Rhodococcus opacus]
MLAAVSAVGVGLSTITIAWQSLMPHIVGRPLAGTAAILDGASYNGARAIGPIIGGALLTATTSEALFLALGVVFAVLVVPLRSRRRIGPAMPRSSERMLPALAASTRFVWNSAWTRRLLYRLSVFGVPSSCLWALLPVIA